MLNWKNMRIAFVGSGKVATALAHIFQQHGISVSGISSRNESTGKALATALGTEFYPNPKDLVADVIFLATNDAAIRALRDTFQSGQFLVYTAGAVPLEDFSSECWGVFYPLQTFTLNRSLQSADIPILLETKSDRLHELLKQLCEKAEFNFSWCDSKSRIKYHLAAVFVNNFVNHFIYKGQTHLENNQLDTKLIFPLIKETIAKLEAFSAFDAQTGPARRNDQETIEAHRVLLNEEDRQLYDVLTQSILKTYTKHD